MIDGDGRRFAEQLAHDVDDEAAFIAHFKATYEQPLQEIFE